jgi:hypothetical protein
MEKHPFSHTASSQEPPSSLRRSTRIEFVTPVFLSGRDATGQRFRELTQTVVVNLHGCKLRTSYHVLAGMLVTLECPKAGTTGKAVCVKVWDAPAGVVGHEIAVQLIKPRNLWSVPNPPADWEIVAKTMVEGRTVQAERPTRAAAPPSPAAPAPSAAAPPPAPSATAPTPAAAPPVPSAQTSPLGTLTVDLRLAELEGRSAQLLESILNIIRSQAEELTRTSLEEFREQVEALLRDAEERLRQSIHQSYEESASSLTGLGGNLMDQMASRSAHLIRSAEETLRAHLRELPGTQDRAAPAQSPKQASQK